MSHISYSELKNWNTCAFYHKLVHIDKLDGFRGNEFTAFGTAIHTICEKKLLHEAVSEELFIQELRNNIASLDDDIEISKKLVVDMASQGKAILPEIDDAVEDYFGEFEVVSTEERLMVPIEGYDEYNFKGFIDAVIKTEDGKYHLVDWKSCSWGWNAQRRSEPMTTYQLTLYKHFYALKHNIDPKMIETHFALLKRTAKKNRVEIFRVTSGPIKTENALGLLNRALQNIIKGNYVKNRLSCRRCSFYKTKDCP
jgi:ATP-dependent exoDNAse (exonuclease V) beta subunit